MDRSWGSLQYLKTSALLGLLSWHIYLYLNIVDTTVDIEFHDPLLSVRGVVILGL